MLDFIKGLFKSSSEKSILKERDQLYKRAVQLQRNGDLRTYGKVMARIEELEIKYADLSKDSEE